MVTIVYEALKKSILDLSKVPLVYQVYSQVTSAASRDMAFSESECMSEPDCDLGLVRVKVAREIAASHIRGLAYGDKDLGFRPGKPAIPG